MIYTVAACIGLLLLLQTSCAFVIPTSTMRRPTKLQQRLGGTAEEPNQDEENAQLHKFEEEQEVDVVVIGAGIGGLSCAALTSKYGLQTVCVEAHDTAGGVAHSFDRYSSASKDTPFRFDSGPSFITGLSSMGTNPLRQVLDAIGTADDVDWKNYNGWLVHDLADGKSIRLTTGTGGEFEEALENKAGTNARKEFEGFKNKLLEERGLSEVSAYIPPFALRGGFAAIASAASYIFKIMSIGFKGLALTGPFKDAMDEYGVKDPFVRKWFDYLSFALSGLDAAHTQAAPVAYMMIDLHTKDAILDYPMGGMDSLTQALVNGMEKHGGTLKLNSRVDRVLLEPTQNGGARAQGVVLANGQVIKARKAVVCNAPLWNMARILQDSVDQDETHSEVLDAVQTIRQQADDMCMTRSFTHLHLGIPSDGLPDNLECHHSVLDMSDDVTAEQNMVIISIPTVFDSSLAPKGYHVVHAYSAACDNFDEWERFLPDGVDNGKVGENPNSMAAAAYGKDAEYQKLKEEKEQFLWSAIERVIPDIRDRAKRKGSVVLSGTPLTHRRYNQRFRGTYGPAPPPGKAVWELPGPNTAVKGLLACGDTTFPGIGLPGVAASGTIAANTIATVGAQTKLMGELKAKGALQ